MAGMLMEGFYTHLDNPFANEYGEVDEDGVVIYTRVNAAEGAVVKGINTELMIVPSSVLTLRSGLTIQSSQFVEEQEFDERNGYYAAHH